VRKKRKTQFQQHHSKRKIQITALITERPMALLTQMLASAFMPRMMMANAFN
jgi:hypothetical protein